MKINVLTVNIWRYFDWDKRKEKLISFLKKHDSDIVFLQEAAYDDRLKEKYQNQVHELNQSLGYKDFIFAKEADMKKWHKEPIDWIMYYGLGILSKFRIKSSEMIILPHVTRDKDFGFLHAVIETSKGDIDVINVHLENSDEGSKAHLTFLLDWCKKKGIKPIIAGDFNMKQTEVLCSLTEKDFLISYKIKPYISFMPTEFSNNKEPITLDYIIANKQRFEVKNVKCVKDTPSDHNPVIADIIIK